MLKAHGRLVGETWEAQADHAEQAVAEVIELQGLDAGRRWALSLDEELQAEREADGVMDHGERCTVRGASLRLVGTWACRVTAVLPTLDHIE